MKMSVVLNLSRWFGLNTSRIERGSIVQSRLLVVYSSVWFVVYPIVWTIRLTSEGEEFRSLQSVNLTVVMLQLTCTILTFYSTIVSCAWVNSRRYVKFLLDLTVFDRKMTQNLRPKSRRVFFWFVAFATIYFMCFIVIDLVLNCFLNDDNFTILHWVTVFLPFVLVYYAVVSAVFSSFLLYQRFDRLQKAVDDLQKVTVKSSDYGLVNLKKLANSYGGLVKNGEDLIWCFSPTIMFLFLLNFLVILNRLFLIFKLDDGGVYDYVVSINTICFDLVEMVALVAGFYATKLKADSVVTRARSLMLDDGCKLSREMVDCVEFMEKTRFSVKVFWIFGLEPSTLLSIGVSILTFLIILFQFSPNKISTANSTSSRSGIWG